MLITRETDYALRILRALSDGEQRSIQEIGEREATPKAFAYRIIKKLERMGWISISRGAEGGCCLITDLDKVNLYELLEGIGADKNISECLTPGYQCSRREVCDGLCRIQPVLADLQKVLDDELRSRTIGSLIRGGEKC